jgi:hypothetical protein
MIPGTITFPESWQVDAPPDIHPFGQAFRKRNVSQSA